MAWDGNGLQHTDRCAGGRGLGARASVKRTIDAVSAVGLRTVYALGLSAALLAASCLSTIPALAQSTPPATAPATSGVPVSAAVVVRQDVPILLRGLGTVQAFNAVQIRPRVDGTLTKVPVAEGQDVKKGDLLAVIDPRPYQAILDTASAKKEQDEAMLASAMADLSRYTALTKQEVASRQKLEEVIAQAKQLRAAIAGDGAQIEAAQLNLSFCYITAPFDGRVGLRLVDPGNQVRSTEATAIMTIAQLHPISATFALAQDTLPAIADAMAGGALPVVASSSDDKTELDRGALLTVDNAIDATTGTIKLKATFPNPKNRLWPGQFVNVRLLIGTDRNALTVPSAAVQHGPGSLYVYAIKPDGTVARQTVTLMRDDGKLSVLGGGVEPGQQVVIDGQSRLQDGSHVAINDTTKSASSQARPGS